MALLRLMVLLLKVSGFSIDRVRLPEDATKERLLRAIDRKRNHFSLRALLRILGLSQTRYHGWKHEPACALTERPRCPRNSPQQLTLAEVHSIRDMVTSDE